jgi:hypothetical protein
MARWRVVREHPLCIRLKPDRSFHGVGVLAFGSLMAVLSLFIVLGWAGVFEMSRDVGGGFATLVTVVLGALALYAGARARWGWCELEIADVAITVVDGLGWRVRSTARIDRPVAGVPLTVVVESQGNYGSGTPVYSLNVHNRNPFGQPILVARGLNLSRETLDEVALLIERWGRG